MNWIPHVEDQYYIIFSSTTLPVNYICQPSNLFDGWSDFMKPILPIRKVSKFSTTGSMQSPTVTFWPCGSIGGLTICRFGRIRRQFKLLSLPWCRKYSLEYAFLWSCSTNSAFLKPTLSWGCTSSIISQYYYVVGPLNFWVAVCRFRFKSRLVMYICVHSRIIHLLKHYCWHNSKCNNKQTKSQSL